MPASPPSPPWPWARLAVAAFLALPTLATCAHPALAQDGPPAQSLRLTCFPPVQIAADVEAGRATMQPMFLDHDGDQWVLIRAPDRSVYLGYFDRPRGLFCAVASGPAPGKES